MDELRRSQRTLYTELDLRACVYYMCVSAFGQKSRGEGKRNNSPVMIFDRGARIYMYTLLGKARVTKGTSIARICEGKGVWTIRTFNYSNIRRIFGRNE